MNNWLENLISQQTGLQGGYYYYYFAVSQRLVLRYQNNRIKYLNIE